MNTLTPWIFDKHGSVCTSYDKDGWSTFKSSVNVTGFGLSGGDTAKANTALIVRAVNSHDSLTSALENILEKFEESSVSIDDIAWAKAALKLAKGEA